MAGWQRLRMLLDASPDSCTPSTACLRTKYMAAVSQQSLRSLTCHQDVFILFSSVVPTEVLLHASLLNTLKGLSELPA